jgi:acyl-coenzyme A synthetase/AMP-(fatty) acid ligase
MSKGHELISDWHELIWRLADAPDGDWPALEVDGRQLTIRQLARRTQAASFQCLGDGSPLIVSHADPLAHSVAVLAATAAGRPALMIDHRTPDVLVATIAQQARASQIVGRSIAGLEQIADDLFEQEQDRGPRAAPSAFISTMLLTSGSTGTPKIVQRTVAADVHGSYNYSLAEFPLEAGDRFLMLVPFASAAFITAVMGMLVRRVTVVFASFQDDLGQLIDRLDIQGGYFVTTMLRRAFEVDGFEGRGWNRLRGFSVGGEKLSETIQAHIDRRFPKQAFVVYGMSEAPFVSFTDPRDLDTPANTVGRLAPGREMRFLDPENGAVLPAGQEGQISVRSPDMFYGYLGQRPIGDWYDSGDLGRMDDKGYVFVTGRTTSQVKVGGNRVSTEEVSAIIEGHELVAKSVVIALDDPLWTTKLVAFVVSKPEAELSSEQLVAWMRARTTAYRVPRQVIFTPRLPMDPSGKLARKTLEGWAVRNPDATIAADW